MNINNRENVFKTGQIVSMRTDRSSLYGEVIQVVTQRQLCWFRPLAIIETRGDSNFDLPSDEDVVDLRSASDLLFPLNLFNVSYDTEAIALMSILAAKELPEDCQEISFHLNSFVKEVWQNNQDKH